MAFLTGVLTVFFDVAYQSYLPHLIGRAHLVEGNAKLEAVRSVSQITGPAVAGFVIQALTAPAAIALDAVSFAVSALYVWSIRAREAIPIPRPDAHLRREILEGLAFVLRNRLLRPIALATASYNLLASMRAGMLIVLLARDLNVGPTTIGVFFSIASAGGLLGALSATRIATLIGQGPAIWLSVAIAGPFQLLLPAAQHGWMFWAAALAYLVIWFSGSVYNITQISFRQGLTPERLLGRMNATMRFLVWGTVPVGGLLGGTFGQLLGARPTLWIAAIVGLLPFLPLYFSPLRTMRQLPQSEDD